jgi:environmental stress-induced protein Ves
MTKQVLTDIDFKEMPWKNGGGTTTELFCIEGLRLSIATVQSDGPFSIFPNVDRILMLIEGAGFHLLSGTGLDKILNDYTTVLHFSGEESIQCTLINGKCRDFNVMTDRNFATTTILVEELEQGEIRSFTAHCDLKFLYDKTNHLLYKLDFGDTCNIEALKVTTLLIIDVKFL